MYYLSPNMTQKLSQVKNAFEKRTSKFKIESCFLFSFVNVDGFQIPRYLPVMTDWMTYSMGGGTEVGTFGT
jgi:hypothetical protein